MLCGSGKRKGSRVGSLNKFAIVVASKAFAGCYQHPATPIVVRGNSRRISTTRAVYQGNTKLQPPLAISPNADTSGAALQLSGRPSCSYGPPLCAAVHSAVPRRLGLQGPKNVPETRANKRGFSCEGEALLGSTRLLVTLGARSATAGATLPLGPVRWFAAAEKRKVGYLWRCRTAAGRGPSTRRRVPIVPAVARRGKVRAVNVRGRRRKRRPFLGTGLHRLRGCAGSSAHLGAA